MNAEVYYFNLDTSDGGVTNYQSIHLQEGRNSFGNETINLQKMQFCFAISSEANGQYQHKALQVKYLKIVLPDKAQLLSMTLRTYFTTAENSFSPEFGFHLSEEVPELKLRTYTHELWGFVELGAK